MVDTDTMTALLWVSIIAGYAWSVWCLDRLCRRADADHDAERRSAVVDMRRYVVTRRTIRSSGCVDHRRTQRRKARALSSTQ